MNRFHKLRYGLAAFALSVVTFSLVQSVGVQAGDPPAKDADMTLEQADMAFQMLDLGRSSRSPEAILAAAAMFHKNPLTGLSAGTVRSGMKVTVEGGEKFTITPQSLLAEAKALRPKDKALAEYIAKLADDFKEKSRGSVNFTGAVHMLGAKGTPAGKVSYTIPYLGKAPAIIQVGPMGVLQRPGGSMITTIIDGGKARTIQVGLPPRVASAKLHVVVREDKAGGATIYNKTASGVHQVPTFTPAVTALYKVEIDNQTADWPEPIRIAVTTN